MLNQNTSTNSQKKTMLKIKLARFGKRNQPHYRIVVNEARSKRDGKYVDLIGHYAPTQTPKILEMNMDLYKTWLEKGAQPTETVAHLAARYESGNPFPAKKATPSKKARAKAAASKAEKAEKASAPAPEEKTETPEAPASEETETTQEA